MRNLQLEIRRRLRRGVLSAHPFRISTIPFPRFRATEESGVFINQRGNERREWSSGRRVSKAKRMGKMIALQRNSGRRNEASPEVDVPDQPTRKRTSRMVLGPKRFFSFRRMSIFET